jgi:hypothetical protein
MQRFHLRRIMTNGGLRFPVFSRSTRRTRFDSDTNFLRSRIEILRHYDRSKFVDVQARPSRIRSDYLRHSRKVIRLSAAPLNNFKAFPPSALTLSQLGISLSRSSSREVPSRRCFCFEACLEQLIK